MTAEGNISIRYKFPNHDELRDVAQEHSFEDLASMAQVLTQGRRDYSEFVPYAQIWAHYLFSRISDVRFSFWLLEYYYRQGIPDEEWWISPGRAGSSIEYFPHFNDNDYATKQLFDYFTDCFYLHLFATWDAIGQWLNSLFNLELGIDEVHFLKVVKKLKQKNHDLYSALMSIISDRSFEEATALRYTIVYRLHPGLVGSGFMWENESTLTIGVGEYTPSHHVRDNAFASMTLLQKTLEEINRNI